MVYKATGADRRSLCTNVCKWTYLGHESRWDRTFFDAIGLGDLFDDGKVTEDVAPMGENAGTLSTEAADLMGLTTQTAVGVGIIDAHAGGIGVGVSEPILALIGGTSSCHMAVSKDARFIPGVWGPYYGAMLPDLWLSEGGQSATGALLDHTIERFGMVKEEDHYWHVLTEKKSMPCTPNSTRTLPQKACDQIGQSDCIFCPITTATDPPKPTPTHGE